MQSSQIQHTRASHISKGTTINRIFLFLLAATLGSLQPAKGLNLGRTGDISFLYILAEWPDRQLPERPTMIDRWQASEDVAEIYWKFHSLGTITSFSSDFTEKLIFPNPAPTDENPADNIDLSSTMREMAHAQGHDLDNYDHIIYSLPSYPDPRSFGALGAPGFVFFPGGTPVTAGLIHELGHAFGFGHAGTFEGGSTIFPGQDIEGRDGLFMMGSEGGTQLAAGVPLRRTTTNAPSKFIMRHLTEDNIERVSKSQTTVRIYDSEVASATAGQMMAAVIEIISGTSQGQWWFSYVPKMAEHWAAFNGEGWADGIVAHKLQGTRSTSIDFTPGSQGGTGNGKDFEDTRDGALRVGQSYTFPDSGAEISPIAIGETDGNRWIDVSFTFPLGITSSPELNITANKELNFQIETNSLEALTFEATSLPAGLAINSTTGIISGTPTELGTQIITLTISNQNNSASQSFTLSVSGNPEDSLDTQGLTWTQSGEFVWTNQTSITYDGVSALETRAEGLFGQSNIVTTITGPVEVSFWWKIESSGSPNNLSLLIDDVFQYAIADVRDWEFRTIQIPEGEHELAWNFRGSSTDEGIDAAWIDQVQLNYGLDEDEDSLSDSWEIGYFGGLSETAQGDFDGDGRSNAEEQIAGTNPINALSAFAITSVSNPSRGIFELKWSGVTGRRYQIQKSNNLTSEWITEREGITGPSGTFSLRVLAFGNSTPLIFAPENSPATALVTGNPIGNLWKGGDEDAFEAMGGDSEWISGSGGIGATIDPTDYEGLFGIDITESYDEFFGSSAFLRVPFSLDQDLARLTKLQLKMLYDSGFVAYLNGIEVTRTDNVTGTPNFLAFTSGGPQFEEEFVFFDISKHISALKPGKNILAIHGISANIDSIRLRLLAVPELVGEIAEFDESDQEEKRQFWRISVQE